MSRTLADKLIRAKSVDTFLRAQRRPIGAKVMSGLTSDVDRLVRSDLNAASRLVERLEELARKLGDPLLDAFAEAGRALVLHHRGDYAEANQLWDRGAAAMRAAGLSTESGIVRTHQVFTLTQMGKYDEALRVARAARRLLKSGQPVYLARLETNVGHVYYRLDRHKQALEHYDRARKVFQRSGDRTARAVVDFSRSNVYTDADQPDEGLSLLKRAAADFDRARESMSAAQCRFHIAYIEFLRGNYNTALASYHKLRDRLAELGSSQLAAWCNLDIAEILLALNAFEDAVETAESARAHFAEMEMPYEAGQATLIRALAAMGVQQFDQARENLMAARQALEARGVGTLTALADCYLAELALRQSEPEEAGERAASALRVFARQKLAVRTAYARLLMARAAYMGKDLAKAARLAKAALRSAQGHFAPGVVYQCHHLIGVVARDRNQRRAALESFRLAVETVERMRGGIAADEFKATFVSDKIQVYEDAIAACLDEGDDALVEEAFRLVESAKSRALADLLSRYLRRSPGDARGQGRKGVAHETRDRLLKLIQDLNWYSAHAGLEDEKGNQRRVAVAERYQREVKRCERQIAQTFRLLEAEGSPFAEMQRMRGIGAEELRAALDPGETAVEYFTTGDQVSAFVASRDRIEVVRAIASKRELDRMLAALRFQIEKFNYGSEYVDSYFGQLKHATDEYLSRFYQVIFAPIEPMLESDRLMIIPHGALHYVPFHALRDGAGYMVDRFEISYAPSAAVLRLCRQRAGESRSARFKPRTAGDGKMVALGVAGRETPSIDDEIGALGELFPDAVTFTGSQATRQNLLKNAPAARFLHLASHGYFRRDNPMFSFLKLADSPLNFYSLLDLRLDAEMVTLSACHTGVNMVFPGDELHGLMRGFLYAGAPSLVASLWAVSDRSTADLMREMYSRIRSGETKRAALRSAQLAVKDDYGHPYYWAPFVLMGNPI
ncbi:MAG TPA: CHAT domain-containing protein [Blastocatellia bacterium]|nr:CHAT domain-containing protein [Blastocatellia bacterium]